jgi:hypothetical protein
MAVAGLVESESDVQAVDRRVLKNLTKRMDRGGNTWNTWNIKNAWISGQPDPGRLHSPICCPKNVVFVFFLTHHLEVHGLTCTVGSGIG